LPLPRRLSGSPAGQFDHYREGGSSSPIVYALGGRGVQLLIERLGADVADVDWTRKNEQAGRQFIQHTLAIADVRVALQRAMRERPGFHLLEPKQFSTLTASSAPFSSNVIAAPKKIRAERPRR
jgi:hypothetical protein